jgi:eukaryotic-like serine/threonine-protein kinase
MQMTLENRPLVILRFGTFEVDLRSGELRKQGVRIKLQEQPFHVLTVLLQRPGEVVTREELRSQNWPADTFVDFDNSLNTAINKLREALGDSADNPRFIETLPRRGYRFIASVTSDGPGSTVGGTGVAAAKPMRNWKAISLLAIIVGTGVVAGGMFWRSRPNRKLTEKDTIVLADFANSTGDPVFDHTLKQELRVQLEQSPFLNILSGQKVNEALQLMGRAKDERLTGDLAREVCQRAGSKATLVGSVSSLGTHYVIGLNVLNCHTGDELGSEQVEADSREHVLKVLGESAKRMRKKLGESLASIQKYDLSQGRTTSSLEALQAYTLGLETFRRKGGVPALPFFKRATELDPNFAMAYEKMGAMYFDLGEEGLAVENTRRAYELREGVSEPERLFLEAHYYDIVTGELEKAAQVYELWQQLYPRDGNPNHNLISLYSSLGKFEEALQEGYETLRLEGARNHYNEDTYVSIAFTYLFLERLERAEAVLKEATEHKLESVGLLSLRYLLAFMKGDTKEMERLVASALGKPGTEDVLLDNEACAKAYQGRLRDAREVFQRSVESSRHNDESRERAANDQADASLTEAYLGDPQHARTNADAALKLAVNRYAGVHAALALALAGDTMRAEKLVGELNKSFPLDTGLQRYWLPTIRAAAALDRVNAEKVAKLLQPISSYELSSLGQLDPIYIRGRAYLMLHNGSGAAAEFQKILDHPGLVLASPVGALAHLGLARAYALQGDTVKSRAAYQDFFSLWKDADPDIPILQQAKAEYAKLQ